MPHSTELAASNYYIFLSIASVWLLKNSSQDNLAAIDCPSFLAIKTRSFISVILGNYLKKATIYRIKWCISDLNRSILAIQNKIFNLM